MSYNFELHKPRLVSVTKNLFKKAIYLAYRDGIKNVAPLGMSGDNILLYGDVSNGRVSTVSLRNYCGDVELLITDKRGTFLFYGRYDVDFGVEFVLEQYWEIFKKCKSSINTDMPKISKFNEIKISDDCTKTIGFEYLRAFQMEGYRVNNLKL